MVTVTRKRRVIEDDENEEDTSKTTNVDERQPGTQVEEKGQNIAALTTMVDRLKRRAAKSAEVAQQTNKRKKLQQTEDNDTIKNSPKKEQSIPKKPKKTQTIPKKSNDDENKNGAKKEEDEVKKKKETPSLLSEMKKPPMPKANVSSKSASAGGKGIQSSTKNKTRPFHSLSPANVNVNAVASTPPSTSANLADASGPLDPAGPAIKVGEGSGDKLGSGLRQLVLDGLKDLCKDAFGIPPERNGDFLFASFLRHKDLKPIMQTSSNSIDSSINNNNNNNLRYDFFDVDETTRTIVLQPKIPIFPEDFPAGGIREWPLSWWGIVDPSIEEKTHEDKASSKNDPDAKISADAKTHSKSRRDRSGARSDGGKEGSGDRTRRENSRNTRKRPSRDIKEEEHAYYNDYPSREDRRDRFPGGEFDDGGDRYAPQLHGADYDYDHNGPSPNGYHPNSRNPHYRGDGQHFPHRTKDGPPPHSHPYHGDGPLLRDFRGGGRPYPAHGSSGPPPWEHSHRDPYGPQGRGPPPPRDDRHDHRDRSQRSPRSKPERDDGRHSVRKPSSSSSGRKDRTRSSR